MCKVQFLEKGGKKKDPDLFSIDAPETDHPSVFHSNSIMACRPNFAQPLMLSRLCRGIVFLS
jgi:hypothetical protein